MNDLHCIMCFFFFFWCLYECAFVPLMVFFWLPLPSLGTADNVAYPVYLSGRQPQSSVVVMLVFDHQLGGQSLTLHSTWFSHTLLYHILYPSSLQSVNFFQTALSTATFQISNPPKNMMDFCASCY